MRSNYHDDGPNREFEAQMAQAFDAPELPNPEHVVMQSGKHKGELLTRVPVGYLKWMVNVGHELALYAEAELKRRGTALPDLEVSAHAIDRASLKLIKAWQGLRQHHEGLHTWLARMAMASRQNEPVRQDRYVHMGIVFVFSNVGRWPVLKSVWPVGGGGTEDEDSA